MNNANGVSAETVESSDRPAPVTLVISHLTPQLGMESAVISLAKALSKTRSVRIVTVAEEDSTSLRSIGLDVESWGSRVVGWRRALTVLRAFKHRKGLTNGPIVLCGVWAAIPLLFTLPRPTRRRCIVWEHSFDSHKVGTSRGLAILRSIARYLYQRSAGSVAVSSSLMRDMRHAGFTGPIDVIPNITRDLPPAVQSQSEPGSLLAVGSLSKTKNQRLAVQMMMHLPHHYTLDVLGDGAERPALEALAAELGVSDRVRFHGYVADPAPYFERSEIMVHPSLGETYGLVLFECASFSKPVVAVNQSVMVDIVPALVPGVLAEPEPTAFAAAVSSLRSDPISTTVFAESARMRQLSAGSVISQWEVVLMRVASAQ